MSEVANGLYPQRLGLDPKDWKGIEPVLKTRFLAEAKERGYSVKWDSKGKPILTPSQTSGGAIWI